MFNLKLMKMKNDEKDELVSLNDKLYDEFYVQELEERLETDPLIVGGLLDLFHLIRYNRGKMFTSLTKNKIGKDFSFVNKNSYKKIRTNLIKIASKFVEDTN